MHVEEEDKEVIISAKVDTDEAETKGSSIFSSFKSGRKSTSLTSCLGGLKATLYGRLEKTSFDHIIINAAIH